MNGNCDVAESGNVSKEVQILIDKVEKGCDLRASAALARAFLTGAGCPRDLDRAFKYAEDLLFEDEDCGVFYALGEAAMRDKEIKARYNKLVQKANAIEKMVESNDKRLKSDI